MSEDPGRIAVPTNGRRPHPPVPPVEPAAIPPVRDDGPSDEEPSMAISPRQLAIGLGVVASLVLLVLGRARRRRPGD